MMESEYFDCSCHSPEHTLKFIFDDDKDFPCIYAYVFLRPEPFFARLWKAIKYVFGYQCRYGHFDEFILRKEDCGRFINLLQKLQQK